MRATYANLRSINISILTPRIIVIAIREHLVMLINFAQFGDTSNQNNIFVLTGRGFLSSKQMDKAYSINLSTM